MDTQIGYEQLRYAVWTVSYSNPIPSGYAQNRIWADSLNEALVFLWINVLLKTDAYWSGIEFYTSAFFLY